MNHIPSTIGEWNQAEVMKKSSPPKTVIRIQKVSEEPILTHYKKSSLSYC